MPLPIQKPVWNTVSVVELWAKIGGGTRLTIDQILQQLDNAERSGRDFRISHSGTNYVVPNDQIRDYFVEHQRPTPKMTTIQELGFLRNRVKELEARLAEAGLMPEQPGQKPTLDIGERERRPAPMELAADAPIADSVASPPGDERPLNEDEIRQVLKKDLKGRKPLVVKGTI
uniref:Uncharacterized protein n=1 Tax=viral metagenome TaxID=1070528 RepID=A0A6M3J0H0_9ZZZZ